MYEDDFFSWHMCTNLEEGGTEKNEFFVGAVRKGQVVRQKNRRESEIKLQ